MGQQRKANHPEDVHAEVWLTDPAVGDLNTLDGAALVWALKKMLVLERNPLAGEPLVGDLVGWRKIVVGDRHWRIIWRPTTEGPGPVQIEIAEVWAVGARSDSAVYDEMRERIDAMPNTPRRVALSAVIANLGLESKVGAAAPRQPATRPEPWLVDRLVHTAKLPREAVEAMTSEEAVDAWTAFRMRGVAPTRDD